MHKNIPFKGNADYWKNRFVDIVDDEFKNTERVIKNIQDNYQKAMLNLEKDINLWYARIADNNNISFSEAQTLLKSDELEEFKWTVEEYIKRGKENAVNEQWIKELENASARVHIKRLEAIKLQLKQYAEETHALTEEQLNEHLTNIIEDKYVKTAFEISKLTGLAISFDKINKEAIDIILKTPWARDGKNFSDRIWQDKELLTNNLHQILTQGLIRGQSPKEMARELQKRMGVSKANAERLIHTETMAMMSQTDKKMYSDLDVKEYEIVSALDMKTCATCGEMDGKRISQKQYETGASAPPFHPRCRCCTVPAIDLEEDDERVMRDENGKSVRVPANMKYEDWKEKFDSDEFKKHNIKSSDKTKVKPIDNNSLKNINYVNFGDESHNDAIKEHHKNLLIDARDNNNGNEVAYFLDKDLNLIDKKYGDIDSIDFHLPNGSMYLLHNHPNNGSFSINDIITLINSQLTGISEVNNSGLAQTLYKSNLFSKENSKTELIRCVNKYKVLLDTNQQVAYNKAVDEFLKKKIKKCGIILDRRK